MVRNEVARNPLGMLGVRGYFKALQKDCKQMQQQPYVPHTEGQQCESTLFCLPFKQRVQGRLKKANIEYVLLAGSSLFLCEPVCVCETVIFIRKMAF